MNKDSGNDYLAAEKKLHPQNHIFLFISILCLEMKNSYFNHEFSKITRQ